MSTDTERVEEEAELSLLETWDQWYHIPVLGVVMVFMFASRARNYEIFITDDGRPALQAVDSWYHWRTVEWTAENYPYTMPYEIFTSFPDGRYVGQFGTLFDQIIVTIAMIVGLGNPSTETLYLVSLLTVPAMAALVAIPVFFMGRRLAGTFAGLISVIILALAPGTFFFRSTAGQLQHHVAEVLFMAIAVLAMMVAVRVAEREKPIWELVVDRDWDALREPTIYSALAGIAIGLYIWIWPPAVVLVGILGVFFITAMCIDYLRGVSPDHLAYVGAVSFGVAGLFAALLIEEPGFSPTSFGYLQPGLAFLGVAGFVFMAWLARQWDRQNVDVRYYPIAVVGLIVVGLGVMAIVLPDFFDRLVYEATGRVMPLDPADHRTTIAEAQQPDNYAQHVFDEFGTAFYSFIAGLLFLAARPFLGREYRTEYTLILVWSLFLISMSMTQVRFAYYLVLAVAVVNAVFIADLVRLFNLDITQKVNVSEGVQTLRNVETYQIIVLGMVVVLLFAPLLPPVAGATAWDRGGAVGPSQDAMEWEGSNHFLGENTPEPGDWAGAGNDDELDYFGTYEYPEGGSYDYPEGTYGVMSWWDYGHLITTQAQRIPHSNPFQSNARSSSWFLTAQDEAHGEAILDGIASDVPVVERSQEEIEGDVGGEVGHEEIRYVMIDHQMAGGKFGAITQWTGPDFGTYMEGHEYEIGGQNQTVQGPGDGYYDTMLASLYLDDADGMEHYRLVHESEQYALVSGLSQMHPQTGELIDVPLNSQPLFNGWTNQSAEYAAFIDQSRQTGEAVPHPTMQGVNVHEGHVVSNVKTFERVEGATLEGQVDIDATHENATVSAFVELETEPGRTFFYTQQADLEEDGSFELRVPYATTEDVGPEDGYTESSVEATGDYTIIVGDAIGFQQDFAGETEVPEMAVIDGETVEVELEEVEDEEVEPPEEDEADPDEVDEDEDGDDEEVEAPEDDDDEEEDDQ